MVTPSRKRLAKLSGALLILLSLGFIAYELQRNWPAIAAWRLQEGDLATLIGLSVFYGASLYLLAENWHRVVRMYGIESRARTYRSYTATQIARYLPGNFAHLLGRAVFLRGRLSDRSLGLATLLELALTPLSACVALLLLLCALPHAERPDWLANVIGFAPLVLALGVFAVLCLFHWARRGGRRVLSQLIRSVTHILGLGTVFMVSLGSVFALLLNLLSPENFQLVASAAILAWLAGYLTPGAPGGIGPREAALLFLLADQVAPADLILATLLFRVVTIAGDVICFVSGWLVTRPLEGMQQG